MWENMVAFLYSLHLAFWKSEVWFIFFDACLVMECCAWRKSINSSTLFWPLKKTYFNYTRGVP